MKRRIFARQVTSCNKPPGIQPVGQNPDPNVTNIRLILFHSSRFVIQKLISIQRNQKNIWHSQCFENLGAESLPRVLVIGSMGFGANWDPVRSSLHKFSKSQECLFVAMSSICKVVPSVSVQRFWVPLWLYMGFPLVTRDAGLLKFLIWNSLGLDSAFVTRLMSYILLCGISWVKKVCLDGRL